MVKFKALAVAVTALLPIFVHAESFSLTSKITKVMAYAKDEAYSGSDCVVYFENQTTTKCSDKYRAVIKADTEIGKLMCSFALTAMVSEKTVIAASEDLVCSESHNAPVLRYIRIHNND